MTRLTTEKYVTYKSIKGGGLLSMKSIKDP